MANFVRSWDASSAALILVGVVAAMSDASADPAAPALAAFVDVAAGRLPENVVGGTQKRIDLQGFPLLVSRGATTNVGIAANYRLELDPAITIDSHGSVSRTRVDSFLGGAPGTERGEMQATLGYRRDWLDLQVTPGAAAEGPEHGMALAYTLDNSAALRMPFGWTLSGGSHAALRRAAMAEGAAGAGGSVNADLSRPVAAGSTFGIGYSYGWSSPESAAVSFEHQVQVSADFAFMADMNCRVAYQQAVAAGAPQNLSIGMDWDLLGDGLGAASLTADVAVQRNGADLGGALTGAANLGLAMKF